MGKSHTMHLRARLWLGAEKDAIVRFQPDTSPIGISPML